MNKSVSILARAVPKFSFSKSQEICLALAQNSLHENKKIIGRLSVQQLDILADTLRGLQIEMTIQGMKASEGLIHMADEALRVSRSAHLSVMKESKKTRSLTNKGFFRRFIGLLTGSSRAELNESLAKSRAEIGKAVSAEKRFIKFYRRDAQVSLRVSEIQSQLLYLDKCVCEELKRERNWFYKIGKSFRIYFGVVMPRTKNISWQIGLPSRMHSAVAGQPDGGQ